MGDTMRHNFWEDKRVLVTGGAGFLGSYIVKKLLELKAKVIVVDDLSKGSIKTLELSNPNLKFVNIDLTIRDAVKGLLNDIDIVFHSAARVGGVGYLHKYPATILRDNLLMTINLWDEAIKAHVDKIIYFSSSMVYERTNIFPTPEDALMKTPPPITSYGFSKLAGEYIVKAYYEEYGIPYVIVRPFNVYGPGEVAGDYVGYARVIPDLIKKILDGQYPLEILGSGEQTRCFTYIEDAIDGILLVAERAKNDDFNVGTDEEIKIIDLAKLLWVICGRKEPFKVKHLPSLEYDVQRRVADITKIKRLGWRPKVKLEEGLLETCKWYRMLGFHEASH